MPTRRAVEKAGGTDPEKVLAALAEVSIEGPRGTIRMDKQRHAPLTMYLGQVQADGSVKVIQSFPNVDPGRAVPAEVLRRKGSARTVGSFRAIHPGASMLTLSSIPSRRPPCSSSSRRGF